MGASASQITSLTLAYSTVYSGADQRKHQKLSVTGFCVGNSPVTRRFPAQRASNAANVSIWWRHHEINYFTPDNHYHMLHNVAVASAVWYKTQPHNCAHGFLVLCLVADIRWLDSPNVSEIIMLVMHETDRYLTKTISQRNANLHSSFCLNISTILWIIIPLNTLRPRQNGRHFPDDIFKRIFLNGNVRIALKISLKFVPKGTIDNISVVQIMARGRPGDMQLSESMMVSLLIHICVTWPQWVCLHTHCSPFALQWRQNERDGVSNQQPHACLLNRLFRHS